MSKFRARQLDATKPIPIYLQEDISDYTDLNNASNRTVPQMPTGMEKEEETEHHLQQAIFHHRVIPVPEVYPVDNTENGKIYPTNYKQPRQLIHIHPFSAEQDIPDYDLDSEDEVWLSQQAAKGELLPLHPPQFEEMMDRLEKSSGLKAVTLQEAKVLLKDDDDLITAVYDYWLNKRLRLQHALIPQVCRQVKVKNEKGSGNAPSDPYVAFRKRTEKMQTRKNRKNDESSYEKMLKLRRDLSKSSTMLQMVSRREKTKRELLHLQIEIFEKRYDMHDWSGSILAEVLNSRVHMRPAFAPLVSNHLNSGSSGSGALLGTVGNGPGVAGSLVGVGGTSSSVGAAGPGWLKVPAGHHHQHNNQHHNTHRDKVSRKREKSKRERKHYRKLKHLPLAASTQSLNQQHLGYSHPPDPYLLANAYPPMGAEEEVGGGSGGGVSTASPSDDDSLADGFFTFVRRHHCQYYAPRDDGIWAAPHEGGGGASSQYSLISLPHQYHPPHISPTPSTTIPPSPTQQLSSGCGAAASQGSSTRPAESSSPPLFPCSPPRRSITLARRRMGRGGRMWVDRIGLSPPPSSRDEDTTTLREHNGLTSHTADLLSRLHSTSSAWSGSSGSSVLSSLPTFVAPPPTRAAEGLSDVDTDMEVDVESVVTSSRVGVSSAARGSQSTAAARLTPPVTLLLTAEMLDGVYQGTEAGLEVTLNGGALDPRLEDDNEDKEGACDFDAVDATRADDTATRRDVLTSIAARSFNSFNSIPVVDSTAPESFMDVDELEPVSPLASPTGYSNPLRPPSLKKRRLSTRLSSSSESRLSHLPQLQHSNFSLQPSSKFVTLDSASPSSLAGFQFTTLNSVSSFPALSASSDSGELVSPPPSSSSSHQYTSSHQIVIGGGSSGSGSSSTAQASSSSTTHVASSSSLLSLYTSSNRQTTLSNQSSSTSSSTSNFVVTNSSFSSSSPSCITSSEQGSRAAGCVRSGAAAPASASLIANSVAAVSPVTWTPGTSDCSASGGSGVAPNNTNSNSAAAGVSVNSSRSVCDGNTLFPVTVGSSNFSAPAIGDSLLTAATTATCDNDNSSRDSSTYVVNSVDSSNKLTNISSSTVSTSQLQSQASGTSNNQLRQPSNSNFSLNNNSNAHEVVYLNARSNNGNSVLSNSPSLRSHHKVLSTRTATNVTSGGVNNSIKTSNSSSGTISNISAGGGVSSNNIIPTTTNNAVTTAAPTLSNGPSSRNNVILAKTSVASAAATAATNTSPKVKCAKLDQYLFRDS